MPEADKTLDVEAFVPCDQVDDVYFDRPYYLAPGTPAGADAFALIRDGIAKAKIAAVARTVLFRRRWRFDGSGMPGGEAPVMDCSKFVGVARWRERHGLPRHVFVHSSTDPKPFYVDLDSPLLVEQMLRDAMDGGVALVHRGEVYGARRALVARSDDTLARHHRLLPRRLDGRHML